MRWEYKRVLCDAAATFQRHLCHADASREREHFERNPDERRRHSAKGRLINPDIADSTEALLNALGAEGWELQTAVNLDSGASDMYYRSAYGVVEYIFRRPVER